MSKLKIELRHWSYTCGDGCCHLFGTKLFLNGKELEHPNPDIKDNGYIGEDVSSALYAVLKELGHEVEIEETQDHD